MSRRNWQKSERPHCCRLIEIFLVLLGFTLAIGWSSITDARADEQSVPAARELEHIALRLKSAEQAVEKRLLSESLGLYLYGYLEGSYTQNFNNPSKIGRAHV